MDFHDDVVLMGHDGPRHLAIAEGKPLKPLSIYRGKPGKGFSLEMRVRQGPVTLLSIMEDRQHSLKFLVVEGVSVPGLLLQIGNTSSRYRFAIGAKAFVNN